MFMCVCVSTTKTFHLLLEAASSRALAMKKDFQSWVRSASWDDMQRWGSRHSGNTSRDSSH